MKWQKDCCFFHVSTFPAVPNVTCRGLTELNVMEHTIGEQLLL